MLRPATVFLSSTFLDLEFERRFVRDLLTERGFHVVTEQDCLPEFDWYQWSLNQALRCDIYLRLFTQRLGTKGILKSSIVNDEADQARGGAVLWLSYRLERPFADQDRLFRSDDDRTRYEQALARSDDNRKWSAEAAMHEKTLRSGVPISSVAGLKAAIDSDVRISPWSLMKHRLVVWCRSYFDTNEAGWRRAHEDEARQDSDHRTAVMKRLRTPITVTAIAVAIALALLRPSLLALLLFVGSLVLASGLITLATLPSYLWIGDKTVVARGMFGLFTRQQSRSERFQVVAQWWLLDRLVDVSAVSVRFADGHRIFVPFVRNATALASLAEEPPPRRTTRVVEQYDPPEVWEARLREFMQQLREGD